MRDIPTCIITGRVVGDRMACGDCDPCICGWDAVPYSVKRLMNERDAFMDKYAEAMATIDEMRLVNT